MISTLKHRDLRRKLISADGVHRAVARSLMLISLFFMAACDYQRMRIGIIVSVINYPSSTAQFKISRIITTAGGSVTSAREILPTPKFEEEIFSQLPVRVKIAVEAVDVNGCLLAQNSETLDITAESIHFLDIHLMIPTLMQCSSSAPTAAAFSVSPTAGRLSGSNVVTLYGSGFVAGSRVQFGGVEAIPFPFSAFSDSEIVVLVPGGSMPGTVDVVVLQPDGTRLTRPDAYTYISDSASMIPVPLSVSSKTQAVSDIAVGDFSGDNRIDIAVAVPGNGEIRLFTGNSVGGFSPIPVIVSVPDVYHISAGNRRGIRSDLVVTLRGPTSAQSKVMILQGSLLPGGFVTTIVPVATAIGQTLTVDLDNDQDYDIVANDDSAKCNCFYVWRPARKEAPKYTSSCSGVLRVAADDYNRDGIKDLLVTCAGAVQRHIGTGFKGPSPFNSDGGTGIPGVVAVQRFEPLDTSAGVMPYGLVLPAARNLLYTTRLDNPNFGRFDQIVLAGQTVDTVVADFDKDKIRDALLTTVDPYQTFLLHGDKSAGVGLVQLIDTSYSLSRMSAADLNNDGKMDVVGINQSNPNEILFLFGNM